MMDINLRPEIANIVWQYVQAEYKTQAEAHDAYRLFRHLGKLQNTEFIHIGHCVFFIIYKNGQAEFHTMGTESSVMTYIRSLYRLWDHLREKNIKSIMTYGDNPLFERIADRMRLNIIRDRQPGPDGRDYPVYRVEI